MTDKKYVEFVNGEMIINFMYEPPPPPEFRLYYDENGNVLFYTGEKPDGNYIVIDSVTFAQARTDVKVVDGEIIQSANILQVHKLKPSQEGTYTHNEDVSLVIDKNELNGQYWNEQLLRLYNK